MGKKENDLKAAIDIGSNTVLLLIGWLQNGMVRVAHEEQSSPRLGRGVDAEKNLHKDSIEKVIDALLKYRKVIEEQFPEVTSIKVTATSAVRDATNKEYFLRLVKQRTGFSVEVLSGKDEAGYTFFGAKSVLSNLSGSCCVIDIGGGSTEVAIGSKQILANCYSYDVGSVRFTERYLRDDPPTKEQIGRCCSAIKKKFKDKIFYFPPGLTLIGVAGTVTSLAHIDLGLDAYNPERVNEKILKIENIQEWISKLKRLGSEEILNRHPKILKGRADVILGGLLIMQCFMESSNIAKIIVSTGGIRHGTLIMDKK